MLPSLAAAVAVSPVHEVWGPRLASALRTALACAIVGCATLFGPPPVQRLVGFSALSYVPVVLIMCEATTLGDTFRGCWHVLWATVQTAVPAVLSLQVIGVGGLRPGVAAAMVGLSGFLVGLPECTHLMTKRIAFGQIVMVYVGGVIQAQGAGVVLMHLLHLASSSALAALASVLALLLPFPRLASSEVNNLWKSYEENASTRLNLFLEAFYSPDCSRVLNLISQAKLFTDQGVKLLQSIRLMEDGILWERPWTRFFTSHCFHPGDILQAIEIPLRGMAIALSSFTSLPPAVANEAELRDALRRVRVNASQRLERAKCSRPLASLEAPDSTGQYFLDIESLKTISPAHVAPSAFFFLSCLQLLQDGSPSLPHPESKLNTKEAKNSKKPALHSFRMMWRSWIMSPASHRLCFPFKCALSLGLAVLFGLMYDKENAYCSGLTIAISFATGRQAVFTVANARAQGTAMGSVFGILGCFVFQSSMVIRFLLLLPWTVFSCFLMHSRMYGQAGGISAVIGALLILGRKHYGSPSDFAIARITQAIIGLSCFNMVEIFFGPRRAATLAKFQLSKSLTALRECTKEMVACTGQTDKPGFVLLATREMQNKLKMSVNELNKFIGEAKLEPNFWFLPFPGVCYSKVWESLSKMEDLLLFSTHNNDFLLQASQRFEMPWKEIQEHINSDLGRFTETVISSLKYLEKITSIESLKLLEKDMQKKIIAHELHLGSPPCAHWLWGKDDEEIEKIITSFLQHSEEIINKVHTDKDKEKFKGQLVLSLGALGFCLGSLMKETREIEKGIQELVQRENPSSFIDFSEISYKINALYVH